MGKNRRNLQLLENQIQIREDQSDNESDMEPCEIDDEIEEEANIIEISSSEDEDLHHIAPSRKRARIIFDSETESEMDNGEISIERASDGTLWQTLKEGRDTGRPLGFTIFKDVSGPTAYAKRNIMLGSVSSAFNLIINEGMMEYIKSCTELEAQRVLKTNWTITISKLRAFVAILYARGAYEARNLKCSYLWSKKWGPVFFPTQCLEINF